MTGIDAVLGRVQEIERAFAAPVSRTPLGFDQASWGQMQNTGAGAVAAGNGTSSAKTGSSDASTAFSEALTLAGLAPAASTASAAPVASAPANPGGPTGTALVDEARKYLGVPYVWGGSSANGLDCSGLVQLSMKNLGVDISRTARQQGTEGDAVASMSEARPGDLLIFNNGTHVGIYTGDNKMIDAPKPGKVVTERAVYETPTAIRRVLPTEVAAKPAIDPETYSTAASQRAALDLLVSGAA